MVEQIDKDIYRIGVVLPNNPLKELNCYLICGGKRDLLIDTGFRCCECYEALSKSLDELNVNRENLDILLTHLHADHTGLSNDIAGGNSRIYISKIDLDVLQYELFGPGRIERYNRYLEEGFPKDQMDYIIYNNPTVKMALEHVDSRYHGITENDWIYIGDYILQPILVPGHTPGHMMFLLKERNIIFTGDHVLFDITPNITQWTGIDDALGDYLKSLERAKTLHVCKALPGHRAEGDYYQRIEELVFHHKQRLNEIIDIVAKAPSLTAYEIAEHMQWKIRAKNWETFPVMQKYFAVGECISHLDHLVQIGRLSREKVNKTWQYTCNLVREDCFVKSFSL